MDEALRTELQGRLKAAETALQGRIAALEAQTAPIAPDCALGSLPRTEAVEQQRVYRSELEAARERLQAVRAALARGRSERFGQCAVCGGAIGAARLRARPEADRCRACAEQERGAPRR